MEIQNKFQKYYDTNMSLLAEHFDSNLETDYHEIKIDSTIKSNLSLLSIEHS